MLISNLEKKLGKSFQKNSLVLGLDTASRTGYCLTKTTNKEITFDYGFIHVQSSNLYFKYNEIIKALSEIIKPNLKLIIEDTYFGKNVNTLKLISRIGMIAYTLAYLKGVKEIEFIYPTTARKNLGLKSTAKKEEVQQQFKQITDIEVEDDDIVDSIILSLNGLIVRESL